MWRGVLVLGALLAGTFAQLTAQAVPLLVQGDRIRLTTSSSRAVYSVEHSTAETLVVLDRRGTSVLHVPFASIERLEISRGKHSRSHRALRGLGIGILIGGATGAVLGYASGDDQQGIIRFTAEQKALVFGILVGGAGGVTGGVVGALTPGERWERIAKPATLSIAPARDGRFGMSISRPL